MIAWFLLDLLCLNTNFFIPCFFLIGYLKIKKVDIFAIICIAIFYDMILYQSKGTMLCLLAILMMIKKLLPQKTNQYLQLNILILSFLFLILWRNHYPIFFLWDKKIFNTLILINLGYFLFIKSPKNS